MRNERRSSEASTGHRVSAGGRDDVRLDEASGDRTADFRRALYSARERTASPQEPLAFYRRMKWLGREAAAAIGIIFIALARRLFGSRSSMCALGRAGGSRTSLKPKPCARPADRCALVVLESISYSIGGATPIADPIIIKSSLEISKLPRLKCTPQLSWPRVNESRSRSGWIATSRAFSKRTERRYG